MKPEPAEAASAASKPAIRPIPPVTTTTTTTTAARTDKLLEETSKAARKASDGNTSLVRALGLKFGRVVIDPGHGGHDQGTQGPKGLLEKDLVLDVGLRLGKLVEERLGREVVYTRKDDTFVPLEGRTAFAEDQRADLFVSIHANSSPVPRISGVETYYLNFTNSKDAIDVASRENASSQKSISQMTDILQTIGKHEKAEESREFAGKIQESLYAFSARTLPGTKDRGVKKAPFVVLIGAKIPSVLVEIGFLSNPREEALLRKPDYRQKLAEALYRGIARYADGLSHFQVAKAGKDE
jgi:N-acetylmuramoyl-L-alanine amidase